MITSLKIDKVATNQNHIDSDIYSMHAIYSQRQTQGKKTSLKKIKKMKKWKKFEAISCISKLSDPSANYWRGQMF